MRKIVSVLICVILSVTQVYAFYDIDNSTLANSVEELSGFGIINGYEDGTFKPENYITRAEFAKIIADAILAESVEYLDYTFNDVTDQHWAHDYIYRAKSLNIISGMSDTTFDPNANITYEQAIKMIVAALGYTDEANEQGGYPNGYINVASSMGIVDGISYGNEDCATRGDIAMMVRNALNCEYYVLWEENGNIERQKSEMTLYELHTAFQNMKDMSEYVADDADTSDLAVG